ncbi:hypothetical protein LSAT2_018750 [Lamellibrachia satsuma]|nr:hypothetical protein LSAT2_018750 [Lamellibrachia satsuma]
MFEMKIARRFRAFFVRVGYTARYTAARERAPLVGVRAALRCVTYVPRPTHCGYENTADVVERVRKDLAVRGGVVLHAETVALPLWMTKKELQEKGDRTFFDGEWYFTPDQEGNEMGPFRHTLLYAIRIYFDAVTTPISQRSSLYRLYNDYGCCACSIS